MIPNIGPMEIIIVLVIALVVFGPKRLPELGNSLGQSIRGFSKSVKGDDEETPAIEPATETVAEAPAKASSTTL